MATSIAQKTAASTAAKPKEVIQDTVSLEVSNEGSLTIKVGNNQVIVPMDMVDEVFKFINTNWIKKS